MNNALIGYTGFIGGLLGPENFDSLYNSKNIDTIRNKSYEVVYCAGLPAVKWLANKDPVSDYENYLKLTSALSEVNCKLFVLISTVDVYPEPVNVDEATEIDLSLCHPYGKHRLLLEEFVQKRFKSTVVRLPGVFGTGLKKNVIYDFINSNRIEHIDSRNIFQFYNLKYLQKDIKIAIDNEIGLLNISSEPTNTAEIALACTGKVFKNHIQNDGTTVYNYKSNHSSLFGARDGYLYSKSSVLKDIKNFSQRPM